MILKMKKHYFKMRNLVVLLIFFLRIPHIKVMAEGTLSKTGQEKFSSGKYEIIVIQLMITFLLLGFSVFLILNHLRRHRDLKALKENNEKLTKMYGELTEKEEKLRQQYTTIREYSREIEHLANNDHLTMLPNRRSFSERLEKEIKRGSAGAILLIDIDDFKKYNDTLGHIYGDVLLKNFAARLRLMEGERFYISRFGGDEFLILLLEEDIEKVERLIQNIRVEFEKPIIIEDKEHYIQISIGIARFPYDSKDSERLITYADTAMYQAKKSGKNNYIFYENSMQKDLVQRTEIEEILRNAIMKDGFIMVYQPQVSIATGEIVGFEALLRLKEYSISPIQFIQIAEETNLIQEIGRIATKKVIEQLAEWREKGMVLKTVSINYSSKQIRDEGYVEFLADLLKTYKIPSSYVEIEITESIFFERSENSLNVLKRLREIGVNLSLDDFGTGFSPINYLTYIPLNKLKLDKSLVDKFLGRPNKRTIESIILLAHSFGLEIVAEGIEMIKQYESLKECGCEYIQGYLFSKPLKAEEIERIYNLNLSEIILNDSEKAKTGRTTV